MDRTVERMKKRERRINQNKDGDRQASKVRCKMGGVEVSKMWPIEAEDGSCTHLDILHFKDDFT